LTLGIDWISYDILSKADIVLLQKTSGEKDGEGKV
jgi:hypothetical protein